MIEAVFVDTNVLIYARDGRNVDKRRRARSWLDELAVRQAVRVNMQVLNELTRWLLRHERGRSLDDLRTEIATLRSWGDGSVDREDVELAWAVRERLGYQWFDCLLLASATRMGCEYFLTEDMSHRASFGPITLIDPFQMTPVELLRPH